MDIDLDHYRQHARLHAPAARALLMDRRRIVVVGARGWIGHTLLELLHEGLGPDHFARRVVCFGSAPGLIRLDGGDTVPQRPLAEIGNLDQVPTMLFHLAFLTKDKVGTMAIEAYIAANRALATTVSDALDAIGVDRLFVASSGAAAFADQSGAADDLRLYGSLKREDEDRFVAWAVAAPTLRRAVVGRIYSVSGPWINKFETYALASFLLDALALRPIEVRAQCRVMRSYVAVRELLSLVVAAMLETGGDIAPVLRFDTGGEPLELAEVATAVARATGGEVRRAPICHPHENRYVGDSGAWSALLARFGMTHLSIERQVAETASWLARKARSDVVRRTG